jgi:hypothetical protein
MNKIMLFLLRSFRNSTLGIIYCLGIIEHSFAQISFTSGIINIDLYDSFFFNLSYGSSAAAIGNSGDAWNDIDLAQLPIHTISGLINNSGTATSVGLNFQSTAVGGNSPSGTYGELFDVDVFFTSATQEDQITGLIPSAAYDLFLYQYGADPLNVNGTSFSSIQPPRPQNSLVLGTGYSENVVIADASGNLNFMAPTGNGNFTALQLTPASAPEPSTITFVSLGVAALLAYRHKFNK